MTHEIKPSEIDRGDRYRVESNESKYDGHVGEVFQIYETYGILKLENADQVSIACPWDQLEKVEDG